MPAPPHPLTHNSHLARECRGWWGTWSVGGGGDIVAQDKLLPWTKNLAMEYMFFTIARPLRRNPIHHIHLWVRAHPYPPPQGGETPLPPCGLGVCFGGVGAGSAQDTLKQDQCVCRFKASYYTS